MATTLTAPGRTASDAFLLDVYRQMVQIRVFEDMVYEAYPKGLIGGGTHLCQGQEAVAVGFAAAMRPTDYSTYTYRSHGHALAKGMSPETAFAELFGRVTGCNRGKGGSMHLTDARLGLMGCFAVVGAGLPVAVGLGRSAQLRGEDRVSVTFFGDGATNEGAFHEALNLAAIWKTPVVFVCENNLYGEYTRINYTTPLEDLAVRSTSYAMPSAIVDGNDVEAVYAAATEAIERARSGGGPTLVEAKTYRQGGHGRGDPAKYRPEGELEAWLARDPLTLTHASILARGLADEAALTRVRDEITADVAAAYERALAAPTPALSEVTTDVYA